jgi:hypothetical protein
MKLKNVVMQPKNKLRKHSHKKDAAQQNEVMQPNFHSNEAHKM